MALEELCAWTVQADAEHSSSHIRYLKNKIAKANKSFACVEKTSSNSLC